MNIPAIQPRFAMACFARSGDDNFARALENHGLLDFYALGTRRGARGISPEHTRLQPLFGLANYIFQFALPAFASESLRFRTFGLFDRWAQSLLLPGHHFFTGYAFAPGTMQKARNQGGLAFLDAWTSHPEEFWDVLTEEQKIWNSKYPPVSRYYQDRVIESVQSADYICVSSRFVKNSFLKRAYPEDKLLLCPYPVDLEAFTRSNEPRPANRPFTILHTGGLSLRKGAPYLFEAFRLILKEVPNAILRVKRGPRDDAKSIVKQNSDLPIEWLEGVDLARHVRRYQNSDLFLFPSIEDGFALSVAEALACGLPVITTPNVGASDLVQPGINGEIVPIRNSRALADAALKWWEPIRAGTRIGGYAELKRRLSFQEFENNFIGHLKKLGIKPPRGPASEE
ncbi:MAG TPA: glycosyltransferase family 4 protein [Verrucomicrobiae bacterium]|jgi:glycosyltransferase involved in cell wall biosynthesis|nr:glycosyltransferase family 4 protein [Verrucomicrobiae bacterium]